MSNMGDLGRINVNNAEDFLAFISHNEAIYSQEVTTLLGSFVENGFLKNLFDKAIFAIPVFHIYHFINERLKKRSHSRSQRTLDKLVNELTKSAGFNDELTFDSAFRLFKLF
ncbi:hypothetical protein RhiirA4_456717 [Rhizophagus irregularis]|uniref:Uncharacterized protein n=1 Tax=Rhizophagus irregularis TaxID=588596 RepID=A0A2I1G8C1_9GLOM|nr:hypothetical protein RhiirA4_456717 [Rhizophagus irregularis]